MISAQKQVRKETSHLLLQLSPGACNIQTYRLSETEQSCSTVISKLENKKHLDSRVHWARQGCLLAFIVNMCSKFHLNECNAASRAVLIRLLQHRRQFLFLAGQQNNFKVERPKTVALFQFVLHHLARDMLVVLFLSLSFQLCFFYSWVLDSSCSKVNVITFIMHHVDHRSHSKLSFHLLRL